MLGIYLKDNDRVAEGTKTCIPCASLNNNLLGERLLIIKDGDGAKAVGLITVASAKRVSVKEFEQAKLEHCISTKDRLRWWANTEPLFLYPITELSLFSHPITVDLPPGSKTLVETPLEIQQYNSVDRIGTLNLCEANDGS